MSDVIDAQIKMKKRGIKEVRKIEVHIKELSEYLETCVIAEVMDRVGDAVRELRKARVMLMGRYELDIEDLLRKDDE